jgi:Ca2+-binding EF-hand superfamily protein
MRWLELLETKHSQLEEEEDLLKAMELLDDDQAQDIEG